MGKTIKKILCSLLVVVMCLTSAPLSGFVGLEWPNINLSEWFGSKASATEEYTEGYYTYTVTDGEATITDVNTSIGGDITIPATLGGYSVTSIGYKAFASCDSLTSVTIPGSVTTIGYRVFYGCEKLSSIYLGDNVSSIGHEAFYNTAYYNDYKNWINGILYIGNYLIKASIKGGNCYIREGTTHICGEAFYLSEIDTLYIPKTVFYIGGEFTGSAFYFAYVKNYVVDEESPYLVSENGVVYSKDKTVLVAYPVSTETKDFVIPSTVNKMNGCNGAPAKIKTLSFERDCKLENWYIDFFYFGSIENVVVPSNANLEELHFSSMGSIGSFIFESGDEPKILPSEIRTQTGSGGNGPNNWDLPNNFIKIEQQALYHSTVQMVTIRNVECEIFDSADTIYEGATICGYKNSTAYNYAKKYGRTFIDIETGVVYDNLDKVKIEFRFADTKEIIDTSDEHLMDQQVAFNFRSIEYGQWFKSAENGILYLDEYYFPLNYFKADWQSAFGDRVTYICKSTEIINAKAGDTIVIYLSVDENQGSVVTPPLSGGDGGSDSGDDTLETKVFPTGYNFEEDSYGFENYDSFIPYGYFKTMYNDGKAWALFTKKWLQEGVCFGMTYTTASLYNSFPSVRTIRDLSKDSILSIGNYDLSLEAFIDYAHIYQFSEEFSKGTVWTNGTTIYNLVKEYLNNDCIGVTIGMTKRNGSGGHRVLAVGIDGDDILIDDPNNMNDYERLTVNSDGTWTFSGLTNWNSDTCYIRYNLDYLEPYKFIKSMNPLNVKDSFIDNFTIDKIAQNSTSNYLSSDSVLLSVDADEYNLENSNITKIELDYSDESDLIETPKLYWIDKNETVTISNINSDNSEIEVAGNENVIKLNLDKSSEINVTIDEEDSIFKTNIDTIKGENYEINNISFDETSNPLILTISCVAGSDTIATTQTETGLDATGISDGTITLTKDDKVIATKTIANADGDIEIKYDKTGGSDSLEVEYDSHTHTYTSDIVKEASCTENGICVYTCYCGDTYTDTIEASGHTLGDWVTVTSATCTENGEQIKQCENCTYAENQITPATGHTFDGSKCTSCGYDKADECDCNCHASGIKNFFFKLILFFQKLFKKNAVCACGMAHY